MSPFAASYVIAPPAHTLGPPLSYEQSDLALTFVITAVACVVIWMFSFRPLSFRQLFVVIDGRPSKSKYHMVLWMVMIVFGHCTICVARTMQGEVHSHIRIPRNSSTLAGIFFDRLYENVARYFGVITLPFTTRAFPTLLNSERQWALDRTTGCRCKPLCIVQRLGGAGAGRG